MSQEYASTPRKYRRAPRSQRNRPMLVTASDVEQQQMEPAAVEATTAVEEPTYEPTPTPVVETSTRPRRLPRFFSTIGKNEQDSTTVTQEKETVAQARIARATRSKAPTTSKSGTDKAAVTKAESAASQPVKPAASTTRPAARANSPFKTRYILGMLIYIVGSTALSSVELNFMQSNHLDKLLTTLNLFGLNLPISSFTLVYLATLVLLLIGLAYFDFLPRGFSSRAQVRRGTTQARNTTQKNSTESSVEGSRNIPPPVRQGVKGADDDLYQEYRLNQRRDKKR